MIENSDRFIVITGGPGSGKSTLIDALERAGHSRTVEAGRAVIQQQVAIDGNALPWRDRAAFAELMLTWEMEAYAAARQKNGLVFFDRGVPDVEGYLRLVGLPVQKHVEEAVESYCYNRRVFIAPPWKEIFRQDRERKQDFDEAVRTCEVLAATYKERGYELVELPRGSVDQRLNFVLTNVEIDSRA
jgi:predicted ATPase